MPEEDNAAVIQRFYEALNHRDLDSALDMLDPDMTDTTQGLRSPDREGWLQTAHAYLGAFPDFKIDVEDLRVEGDTIVARTITRGTLLHEFEGRKPTGLQMSVPGETRWTVEGGRAVGRNADIETAMMVGQLGGNSAGRDWPINPPSPPPS